MSVQIQGGHDLVNLWVDIAVEANAGREIQSVTTILDGFSLANDFLVLPETSYVRQWHQVGTAVTGATHTIVVNIVYTSGETESASNTFEDFNR